MGFTLQPTHKSRQEVRSEVNKYTNTSDFDTMLINGKTVGDRKKNRAYQRELYAKHKQSSEDESNTKKAVIVKKPFVDNNDKRHMNFMQKRAACEVAMVKLASIRLAINYILRNREMTKEAARFFRGPRGGRLVRSARRPGYNYYSPQAVSSPMNTVNPAAFVSAGAPGRIAGGPFREPNSTPSLQSPVVSNNTAGNSTYYPDAKSLVDANLDPKPAIRSVKVLKGLVDHPDRGIWDRNSKQYNFNANGMDPWGAYTRERERIDKLWSLLNEEEKKNAYDYYKWHSDALDNWKLQQDFAEGKFDKVKPDVYENPSGDSYSYSPSVTDMYNSPLQTFTPEETLARADRNMENVMEQNPDAVLELTLDGVTPQGQMATK